MISLTLYGGGAFYANPDSIDYVRELSPLEHEQYPQNATCVISIGGKEFFVRGLAQNVAAEIQDENKTTRVQAQPADRPETGGTPEKKTGSRVAGETASTEEWERRVEARGEANGQINSHSNAEDPLN